MVKVREDFLVPASRAVCRARFREMSLSLQRFSLQRDDGAAISDVERYEFAERIEAYIFADDDASLQHIRWMAAERAVARHTLDFAGWAALARDMAAEEAFLRSGSALIASSLLQQSLDVFKDINQMLRLVDDAVGASPEPAAPPAGTPRDRKDSPGDSSSSSTVSVTVRFPPKSATAP